MRICDSRPTPEALNELNTQDGLAPGWRAVPYVLWTCAKVTKAPYEVLVTAVFYGAVQHSKVRVRRNGRLYRWQGKAGRPATTADFARLRGERLEPLVERLREALAAARDSLGLAAEDDLELRFSSELEFVHRHDGEEATTSGAGPTLAAAVEDLRARLECSACGRPVSAEVGCCEHGEADE